MKFDGVVEAISFAPIEATGPGKPRAVISSITFQTPIGSAQFMVPARLELGQRVTITVEPAGAPGGKVVVV